jgi:hypothetical protein
MPTLARYLQEQFQVHWPPGWECEPEVHLLAPALEAVLGYAPRADVLMNNKTLGQRLWVEFEASRADPVANHAKFATGHLFQPQPAGDLFVSMVSRHVNRGRRNLAANTIPLLRRIGMHAVQPAKLRGILHVCSQGNELLSRDHRAGSSAKEWRIGGLAAWIGTSRNTLALTKRVILRGHSQVRLPFGVAE